jgi:hypothetical protein
MQLVVWARPRAICLPQLCRRQPPPTPPRHAPIDFTPHRSPWLPTPAGGSCAQEVPPPATNQRGSPAAALARWHARRWLRKLNKKLPRQLSQLEVTCAAAAKDNEV